MNTKSSEIPATEIPATEISETVTMPIAPEQRKRESSTWSAVRRCLALILAGILVLAVMRTSSAQAPSLPLQVNVGSSKIRAASDGSIYLADQEWEEGGGYGYIGGSGFSPWPRTPVVGTDEPDLFQRQRLNWREYRVDGLAPGEYIVRLSFAERRAQGPNHSVFSVQIEDDAVLSSLDLFEVAGLDRAYERSFLVRVDDGELNIEAVKDTGNTQLAALILSAADRNDLPPTAPSNPTATPTYNGVILTWTANSGRAVDGYHVYRSSGPSQPLVRITDEPAYGASFIDHFTGLSAEERPSATKWRYAISSVDLFGRESVKSAAVEAQPLDPQSSGLPVYEMEISEENLATLQADVYTSDEVPATIRFDGQIYPAEVRFRGGFGRKYPKKSWKVIFPNESPIAPRDRMNLRAQYEDSDLLRGQLTTQLYQDSGIRPPESSHTLFFVNGEYAGLFNDFEQVDEEFLKRTRRNPEASIYGINWTWYDNWGSALESVDQYHEVYSKETNVASGYGDIIAFTEEMTYTDDNRIAAKLAQRFDVKSFLNYYAVIVLTQNMDFTRHNIYLVHDLARDQWEVIPWDPDYTWGIAHLFPDSLAHWLPIDMGTEQSPQVFNGPNNVLTRVLDVPQYRSYYCSRQQQFLDLIFSEERQSRIIDANYAMIQASGMGDWHKVGAEDNRDFEAGPASLEQWVSNRRAFLLREIDDYCQTQGPFLLVNEVMTDNRGTICDPDEQKNGNCYDPWIEIYNAGLEPQSLQGLYLTDDSADPTRFQIKSPIVVPPLGYSLFWADSETDQGLNHTNFRPAKNGGTVSIYDSDGKSLIDSLHYKVQDPGHSSGRHPDGSIFVEPFAFASPNSRNRNGPSISLQQPETDYLRAKLPVTIQANIIDDGRVADVTLFYRIPGQNPDAIPMQRIEFGRYGATLPPQPQLTLIEYYIAATDNDGLTTRSPSEEITDFYTNLIGYRPPPVQISQIKVSQQSGLNPGQSEPLGSSWIELRNIGSKPVTLDGMVLTSSQSETARFEIPQGTVLNVDRTVVFYTDGRSEVGPDHATFILPIDGAEIALLDVEETYRQVIDSHSYSEIAAGTGQRRCHGENMWLPVADPTLDEQQDCHMNFLPMLRYTGRNVN